MIKVIKFEPQHAVNIKVQAEQFDPTGLMTLEYATHLANSGVCLSGMIEDRVVFCGGIVEIWKDRYSMWSMLSDEARVHITRMTKIGRRMIAMQTGPARVEMIVKSSFQQAHRWAGLLGFQLHHHEERYLPDGSDADIYVRFI